MGTRGETAKAEASKAYASKIEDLKKRASRVGAPISNLLKAELIEEAEALVIANEKRLEAEEAVTLAGTTNRFKIFYNKTYKPLSEGKLPRDIEDREFFFGLRDLYPREGRGGGTSDWGNKGVAKALSVLLALGALNPDYASDFKAVAFGKAKEADKIPGGRKFSIPDNLKNLKV